MIKRLRSRIEKLRSDPSLSLQRKVRRRVGRKAAERLAPRLEAFVDALPEMIRRLQALWSSAPETPLRRQHSSLLFSYVLHPADLVNEEKEGLFGLVDDAYLVSEILLRENPAGLGDLLPLLTDGREAAKKALPISTNVVLRMVDDVGKRGDWSSVESVLGANYPRGMAA